MTIPFPSREPAKPKRIVGALHDVRCKGPRSCRCRKIYPVVSDEE